MSDTLAMPHNACGKPVTEADKTPRLSVVSAPRVCTVTLSGMTPFEVTGGSAIGEGMAAGVTKDWLSQSMADSGCDTVSVTLIPRAASPVEIPAGLVVEEG